MSTLKEFQIIASKCVSQTVRRQTPNYLDQLNNSRTIHPLPSYQNLLSETFCKYVQTPDAVNSIIIITIIIYIYWMFDFGCIGRALLNTTDIIEIETKKFLVFFFLVILCKKTEPHEDYFCVINFMGQ